MVLGFLYFCIFIRGLVSVAGLELVVTSDEQFLWALDVAQPGDSILIPNVQIDTNTGYVSQRNGTESNPITVRGLGINSVLHIDRDNRASLFTLEHSNWIFDNLRFECYHSCLRNNHPGNLLVSNSFFGHETTGGVRYGISDSGTYVLVENCTFYIGSGVGIEAFGSRGSPWNNFAFLKANNNTFWAVMGGIDSANGMVILNRNIALHNNKFLRLRPETSWNLFADLRECVGTVRNNKGEHAIAVGFVVQWVNERGVYLFDENHCEFEFYGVCIDCYNRNPNVTVLENNTVGNGVVTTC